jgi:hypothetical protein
MTDPQILAKAIQAAAQAEEQRQAQLRKELGEFVAGALFPKPRDEQGRFTQEGRDDA